MLFIAICFNIVTFMAWKKILEYINTRGAYFKFSRRRGALIQRRYLIEMGANLSFPKSWSDMIVCVSPSEVAEGSCLS